MSFVFRLGEYTGPWLGGKRVRHYPGHEKRDDSSHTWDARSFAGLEQFISGEVVPKKYRRLVSKPPVGQVVVHSEAEDVAVRVLLHEEGFTWNVGFSLIKKSSTYSFPHSYTFRRGSLTRGWLQEAAVRTHEGTKTADGATLVFTIQTDGYVPFHNAIRKIMTKQLLVDNEKQDLAVRQLLHEAGYTWNGSCNRSTLDDLSTWPYPRSYTFRDGPATVGHPKWNDGKRIRTHSGHGWADGAEESQHASLPKALREFIGLTTMQTEKLKSTDKMGSGDIALAHDGTEIGAIGANWYGRQAGELTSQLGRGSSVQRQIKGVKIGDYTVTVSGRTLTATGDGEYQFSKRDVLQALAVIDAHAALEKAQAAVDDLPGEIASVDVEDETDSDGIQLGCTYVTRGQIEEAARLLS